VLTCLAPRARDDITLLLARTTAQRRSRSYDSGHEGSCRPELGYDGLGRLLGD
jgi:hypothetical protein